MAPRILNLDNMVQPLESNGQQAGYNPQPFWAPGTVACLCVLEMKVHFSFLSTYFRKNNLSSALSLVGAQNMSHLFGIYCGESLLAYTFHAESPSGDIFRVE